MQVICAASAPTRQPERYDLGQGSEGTHIVAIPPTERCRHAQQHRDLLPFGTPERVANQVRREVAVLEREHLALAARRLLPRHVRAVRARDGRRIDRVGQDGLASLIAPQAAEVGADERDDLLVVQAVAARGRDCEQGKSAIERTEGTVSYALEPIRSEDDEASGGRFFGAGDGEERADRLSRSLRALGGKVDGDDLGNRSDLQGEGK